jgi:hypothetical protein
MKNQWVCQRLFDSFNVENHGYMSTRVFDFREPWL